MRHGKRRDQRNENEVSIESQKTREMLHRLQAIWKKWLCKSKPRKPSHVRPPMGKLLLGPIAPFRSKLTPRS